MQVLLEMLMGLVVIPPHSSILQRAIHSLHLTVRPWVLRLGESVIDPVLETHAVEDVHEGISNNQSKNAAIAIKLRG